MNVYVVICSHIYMMCETFYLFDSVYKNREDAEKRLANLKNNGDNEAFIQEEILK